MSILRFVGGMCGVAALVLAAGTVGNFDYADALVMEAVEKEMRPQRARAYHRELLCDCLKTHRGRPLRLQITQQPDMEMCSTTCWYDGTEPTKGVL